LKYVQGSALIVIVIAGGRGVGGALGAWRYGKGLGERIYELFLFQRRYGLMLALVALIVMLVAILINGGVADLN
jgi:hypothetical protein